MAKQQHDKKFRGLGQQAVTANRLADGAVVYRTAFGAWSTEVDDAETTANSDVAEALLAQTAPDVRRALIVAPYLIDVEMVGERLRPSAFRERIRAFGPTVPATSDHYDSL